MMFKPDSRPWVSPWPPDQNKAGVCVSVVERSMAPSAACARSRRIGVVCDVRAPEHLKSNGLI